MSEPWCVVYNTDGLPLKRIKSKHALLSVLKGKSNVIKYHDDLFIRTVKQAFPAPKEIVPKRHVKVPSYVKFSIANLKRRDEYQCQYCGRKKLEEKEFFTKDHIIPTSRGGQNDWLNVVLCCSTCNNIKGDHTPKEAGMSLLREPFIPTRWSLAGVGK